MRCNLISMILRNIPSSKKSIIFKFSLGCDFETQDPGAFGRHVSAIRTCEICAEEFHGKYSSQNHKRHLKKHQKATTHNCEYCGKVFKNRTRMLEHSATCSAFAATR